MADLKKSDSNNYLFLTAMLRAREANMLGSEKLERILSAPGFNEACAVAMDCGYPDMKGMSIREVEDTLSAHRREEIEDVALIVPDKELVDLFRLKYDYHSAKVMVKSDGAGKQLLSFEGRVEAAEFLKAFARNELGKCCFMPIDRENPRKAIVTINKAAYLLKTQEVSIGVYPEGTRSKNCELLPFHNGVFKIAQKAEAPIVVLSITGTEKIFGRTPFKPTDVYLDILEVFPNTNIKELKTEMIGITVRHLIATNKEKRDAIWQKDM